MMILRFALCVWLIALAIMAARRKQWFRFACIAAIEAGAICDWSPAVGLAIAAVAAGAIARRSIWELYLAAFAALLSVSGGDPQILVPGWFSIWFYLGLLALFVYRRVLLEIFAVSLTVLVASFSVDRWNEVFDVIRRNKLRTFLTSVSVAWGIFVLVTLLGMGQGLDRGMRYSFRHEAANTVHMYANKTSQPAGGYAVGRQILFDNRDLANARKADGVVHMSGTFFLKSDGVMRTRYGAKANVFQINAVGEDANYIEQQDMIAGRFLHRADIDTRAKVAVIGKPVADFLFEGKDGIGGWIVVAGVPFEVIGVFTNSAGDENARQLYIPITTAQLAFNGADHVNGFQLTVGDMTAVEAKAIEATIVEELAERHGFSPTDKQAVHVFDNVEGAERFAFMFKLISVFVTVIGIGTLAAGVVGVSNIMMITVKERTKEIGVRKALGATPRSIVAMVIQEAVFLTGIAGLLGLCGGIVACQVIDYLQLTDLLRDPFVNIQTGIVAAIGLVIAGAIAGYVPARAAARVNPIHALRDQ
jgi:putative ABC transport system permease protein